MVSIYIQFKKMENIQLYFQIPVKTFFVEKRKQVQYGTVLLDYNNSVADNVEYTEQMMMNITTALL